jgi:hypothetical protein
MQSIRQGFEKLAELLALTIISLRDRPSVMALLCATFVSHVGENPIPKRLVSLVCIRLSAPTDESRNSCKSLVLDAETGNGTFIWCLTN